MDDAAFRQELVGILEGGHAHVTAKHALASLPPGRRNTRPSDELRSVWEELEHLRIAQHDILRYTLDAKWKSPKWPEGYWPEPVKKITDEIWTRSTRAFFRDLKSVVALAKDTQRDLTAAIPHGEGRTYLRQILLVADHNAYHLGQIVTVRKLLGEWKGRG
jgi:uncharacterized damage-inducible protein DinB